MQTGAIFIVSLIALPILIAAECGVEIQYGGPSEEAEQHYDAGKTFGEQGQFPAALAEFDEAIRLHPNYFNAYNERGFAYDELGQYQRAIEDYSVPISYFPQPLCAPPCITYDILYVNRAVSLASLGQYQRAIEDLNEAIRLNPQNSVAFMNRGVDYDHLGQYRNAIEDFNEAIRLDPQFAAAFHNRGDN